MNTLFNPIFLDLYETNSDKIIYNGTDWFVLKDLKMQGKKVHLLIIPKKKVIHLHEMPYHTHIELVSMISKLISDYNLFQAYTIHINGGIYQHVKHLHIHVTNYEIDKV
jgi:diadenosine tetraphosphate (Ap4A) HIT family hydrolase